MSQIILDIGSGKSLPDWDTARKVIDAVAEIDTDKHEVVFKTQLFESAPPNEPLSHSLFCIIYNYAKERGYKCTSSVFDKPSLDFLLQFDIPFVKIACRPDLYWLIGEVPRRVPVYMSRSPIANFRHNVDYYKVNCVLYCVPEYPAKLENYPPLVKYGYSDHTVGLELWNKYSPDIWEKHIVLTRDAGNPDSGSFALTPIDLKEIL